MKSEQFIIKLKQFNKSFYTLADMQIIVMQSRSVLRVLLSRLVKDGKLLRLQKNIYVLKDKVIDYEFIAAQIDSTSYISFESALSVYGILSQIPYVMTFATAKRSKKITLGSQKIVYRKLKMALINNYVLEKNRKIATPEKAFLDTLYMIDRGKMSLSLTELDLSILNKKKLQILVKIYPKNVQKQVAELLKK